MRNRTVTCEQLQSLLPEYLYDELDVHTRADIESHLASCSKCADTITAMRNTQTSLDEWAVPSTTLTDAQVTKVIADHAGRDVRRYPARHLVRSLATGALAAVVVFAALSFYQHRTRAPFEQLAMNQTIQAGDPTMTSANESKNEFLLLLLEHPTMFADMPSVTEDDLVSEYQAWAGGVAQQQRTIVGKKLTDERYFLGTDVSGGGDTVEAVAGYFRIGADSLEEALSVARTCPHLKYGGRIEVRQVDGRTED